MKFAEFRSIVKPWILPIAMLLGIIFHNDIGRVAFLSKYLIFVMLLITYCRVSLSSFRVSREMWLLLAVQIVGGLAVYFALLPFGLSLAQGTFICVFCPTATAAPIVTGMLGGSVARVATFSVLSHASVALLAPPLFSFMEPSHTVDFAQTLIKVFTGVFPIILGPLAIAALMQRFAPKAHSTIANHQSISFYIWSVALLIVVGNSVGIIMNEPPSSIPIVIALASLSLAVCAAQFWIGRKIGKRFSDPITCAQSLGQKNTILAIWLATTYLSPLASVGPAAYVAWHNTLNSYQIYRHTRHKQP